MKTALFLNCNYVVCACQDISDMAGDKPGTDKTKKNCGRTAAVKYKKLKKKSRIIKPAKLFKISGAKGKLTYKYVTAKKGKKSFKKYFKVGTKSGKLKVRKGLKKGIYRVKVKVRAAGDSVYKASPWKSVVFKVKVK